MVTEQVQANHESTEQRISAMELSLKTIKDDLTGQLEESQQKLTSLENSLDKTESFAQRRREPSSGGNGDSMLTNC
ncbi:Phage capsid scaffolding protein (GPO) serine peptidase [compost metagenome]